MDTRLSEYGWSGSADCSLPLYGGGTVLFNTEGYLYNNATIIDNEGLSSIYADYTSYNGLDIGLVLWYNNEGYIKYTINTDYAMVERILNGKSVVLAKKIFNESDVKPVQSGMAYIGANVKGTNIKCWIEIEGSGFSEVFNLEQNFFSSGAFGVYASAGETLEYFCIEKDMLSDWNKHTADGCSIIARNNSVYFTNLNINSEFIYIEQEVNLLAGSYTVSFDYKNDVTVKIFDTYNTGTVISEESFSSETLAKASHTFSLAGNTTVTIQIGSSVYGKTHYITKPQIEAKSFDTSFISGTRARSYITFPAQNITLQAGGLGLLFKPKYNYADGTLPLFYYNNSFKLTYQQGVFTLVYGIQSLTYPKELIEDAEYYISCIWENGNTLILDIAEGDSHEYVYDVLPTQTIQSSNNIYIGSTPTASGNLVVDNLVVYKNYVDLDTLLAHKDNEYLTNNNIALKCIFNESTLLYDANRISLPVSRVDSPIIVENSAGDIYSRVYFLDENNEYCVYNKEAFIYDGTSNIIETAYEDFIRLSVYTENMDKIFEDITVNGNSIVLNDITEDDIGKTIIVRYIVNNTYCINYNQKTNQYEIQLSNVNGNNIKVQYEEADGNTRRLIKTVELNPFESVNNSGFIYIENTARPLETFDIKITPDSLMANGYDTATISVDCLSIDGIPTSNVELEVISLNKYGDITRYVSEEEQAWLDYAAQVGEETATRELGNFITDEHRSGRFIYKYKAGQFAVNGSNELVDQIVIRDKVSGIGMQVPIRLVRE